jgi:hypothetical protein
VSDSVGSRMEEWVCELPAACQVTKPATVKARAKAKLKAKMTAKLKATNAMVKATRAVPKKSASVKKDILKPRSVRTRGAVVNKKPAAEPKSPLPCKMPLHALRNIEHAPAFRKHGVVRVGSDCSGWCSEVWASRNVLFADVVHVFASDDSSSVRTWVKNLPI